MVNQIVTGTPTPSRFIEGKVAFFKMSDNYNNFLRSIEPKINTNVKNGEIRPSVFIGILLNGHKYVIPLTSQNDTNWNSQVTVRIKDGQRIISCLKINNMHPVSEEEMIYIEFDQQEEAYADLLKKEHRYIKDNIEDITQKVIEAHKKVYKGKNKFFVNLCCDYVKLEKQYKNYDRNITYPRPI